MTKLKFKELVGLEQNYRISKFHEKRIWPMVHKIWHQIWFRVSTSKQVRTATYEKHSPKFPRLPYYYNPFFSLVQYMLTKSWIHGLTLEVLTLPFTKRGVNWVKLHWHVLQKCWVRPAATRKAVNFGWHLMHHTTHLWCIQYCVKVDQTNSARELLQLSWKHHQN